MANKKRSEYLKVDDFDAFEDIKNADTSGNKPNSLVEKILVKMVEEQKIEIINLRKESDNVLETKNIFEVENAVLKNELQINKILEIVRNISSISIGIFCTLIFSPNETISKFAMFCTPFFLIIFILTFLKSIKKITNDSTHE